MGSWKDRPTPPTKPETDKQPASEERGDYTVEIPSVPKRIGERPDDLRRRAGWFRKRGSGASPPRSDRRQMLRP